jgi:hypothetical protein
MPAMLNACDELVHLWQPLQDATNVSFLSCLSGGILWKKIETVCKSINEKINIVINSGKYEKHAKDLFSEVDPIAVLVKSDTKEKLLPRLEIAVPNARSDMKMHVDMVCYFGITVRASIYSEYLLRYCLLGENGNLVAIDEVPLKVGLEIDWVYTGNFLCGGLCVHRVAIFDGKQVDSFTLWTKTDLDKIANKQNEKCLPK